MNTTKDTLELRFQVRASTFFQKCRDQQWYINQLLRQQSQNLTLIRDLKDRLEREQMKNIALQQSTANGSSSSVKISKMKIVKDPQHVEDLLLLQQQQQAILNDATTSFSITDDLKKLSSDASRNRNRSSENRKTDSSSSSSSHKSREKSLEKAKQSVSAPQESKAVVTTTTSLAISFSSPNLATNTSFSSNTSSSDSDFIDCISGNNPCVTTTVKIQNPLDDISSLDDGDESLNLVGENDVEYAELTQRMIFPSAMAQKPLLENTASSEESDLMIMNLFEASSAAAASANMNDSSSHSSNSSCTAPRISSVLENFETVPSPPSSTTGALANSYNSNDYQLPSDLQQENAHSLPLPLENSASCASPVWKTQVSLNFSHTFITFILLFSLSFLSLSFYYLFYFYLETFE